MTLTSIAIGLLIAAALGLIIKCAIGIIRVSQMLDSGDYHIEITSENEDSKEDER